MSKIFIDTNILVYCMDEFNKKKQATCRAVLKSLTNDMHGVISTQVMQEFYVATTAKLGADPLLIKDILHSLKQFEIVTISSEIIYDAVDCSILNQISFWDSLIVVAAESACCEKVWTEDLNHGQMIRGVKIENPIALEK